MTTAYRTPPTAYGAPRTAHREMHVAHGIDAPQPATARRVPHTAHRHRVRRPCTARCSWYTAHGTPQPANRHGTARTTHHVLRTRTRTRNAANQVRTLRIGRGTPRSAHALRSTHGHASSRSTRARSDGRAVWRHARAAAVQHTALPPRDSQSGPQPRGLYGGSVRDTVRSSETVPWRRRRVHGSTPAAVADTDSPAARRTHGAPQLHALSTTRLGNRPPRRTVRSDRSGGLARRARGVATGPDRAGTVGGTCVRAMPPDSADSLKLRFRGRSRSRVVLLSRLRRCRSNRRLSHTHTDTSSRSAARGLPNAQSAPEAGGRSVIDVRRQAGRATRAGKCPCTCVYVPSLSCVPAARCVV